MMAATVVYSQEDVSTPDTAKTDEAELYFADADNPAAQEVPESPAAFGMSDLIRMVIVLVGVVAAIYGLVALLKRVSVPAQREDDTIRVLASQTLMGNKTVHVIQVGRQMFLLGGGDNSVGLIAEISDQETIQQLELNYSATDSQRTTFAARLASVFARENEGAIQDGLSVLQNQRERLRGLGQ